ncbi:cuticle protein AM1199-like [Penaeus japonicus]|uniref:cuticle protein AM1199-like n=1 Tax=Penaeus japonicus TaxID=27405 RepID=UPI001C70E2AB|nr:cuticle protein AM1199-like [Penaeus japonicus]
MQLLVAAALVAVAVAAPQFGNQFRQFGNQFDGRDRLNYRPIAILRDERQDYGDGNFNYQFETENGISVNARGTPGSKGQSNIEGAYRFPLDDGTFAEVRYIADEFGFRAESPLIPTPHPLPAHAIEQIRFAEEQRRRGITY